MEPFSVLNLLDLDLKAHDDLELTCLAGRRGLLRPIRSTELNRPGLALSGFFDNFGTHRIQIFGRGETAYLRRLARDGATDSITKLMHDEVPCCVFSHGLQPTADFNAIAERCGMPVLGTGLATSEFTIRIIRALTNVFAVRRSIHGTLVEVFGIGVLILGESGVGKSEAALELIERGHRLVADDVVELRRVAGDLLLGQGTGAHLGHHMEIRGLGIINITHLYGVGAIRDTKQVQLVCQLEEWGATKNYDRIGTDQKTWTQLEIEVPFLEIPVKPGRNVPIIIETAAMNERLKKMGYNSAREFNKNVMRWLQSEGARNAYLKRTDLREYS